MEIILLNGVIGLVLIGLSFPLHEILHWLPAKFYRLHTELEFIRKDLTMVVSFYEASPVQKEVILLSPLALDMPLLFCALLFLFNFPSSSWYIVLVPLAMAWGVFNSIHDIKELKQQRDTQ